jgi:hypothetical protein
MMRLIARPMLVALIVALAEAGVLAASHSTYSGKERGFWGPEDGYAIHSVVYAEVVSVKAKGPSAVTLVLDIRATLAGPYEAAAGPTLEVSMRWTHVVRRPPAAKAHVVVVLLGSVDRPYGIPDDSILFMPAGAALVEVQNLDDPKVGQIISRLRVVRAAKPQETPDNSEDYKRAAERVTKEKREEQEREMKEFQNSGRIQIP